RKKQEPPADFASTEKTLWSRSEDLHLKGEELEEQAKAVRKKAKEAAAPHIAQAEALELQAHDLHQQGNETHSAMMGLVRRREQDYTEAQMKIIKEKKLGDCPKCQARSKRKGNGLNRSYPCTEPGKAIILP